MNLVIDSGNTRIKLGLFEGENLLKAMVWENADLKQLPELIAENRILKVILSDVSGKRTPIIREFCKDVFFFELTSAAVFPFINAYKSETLGADRIANVAGAVAMYPGEACLILDAGTCVTYDFVDDKGVFLGGNITPGLLMRLKAMHSFTGKLPLPEFSVPQRFLGSDTQSCLIAGVYFGLIGEIQYFIEKYKQEFNPVRVILTGGDSEVLAMNIKSSIFVSEHLLLFGLNKLLSVNAI